MTLKTIWRKPSKGQRFQVLSNQAQTFKTSPRMTGAFLLASIAALSLFFGKFEGANGETLSSDNIVYQHANGGIVVGVPNEDDNAEKRGSGFMPMRGRRNPNEIEGLDGDKRASAFSPSRGKKDSLYYYPEGVAGVDSKRASAFLHMRGRRPEGQNGGPKPRYQGQFYDEEFEDGLGYKRAAFMPMRGRKSSPMIVPSDKRLQGSFLPMRGRKWQPESNFYGDSEDSKRASAFTAMRGRKKAYGGEGKRLNAFMPMRGKKDSGEEDEVLKGNEHEDFLDEEILVRPLEMVTHGEEAPAIGGGGQEDKRAGSFFGMRGKRYAKPTTNVTKKRSKFIITRGKRSTDSAAQIITAREKQTFSGHA